MRNVCNKYLCFIIVLIALFSSCFALEDEDLMNEGMLRLKSPYGTWELTGMNELSLSEKAFLSGSFGSFVLTFSPDNTFKGKTSVTAFAGTYKIEDRIGISLKGLPETTANEAELGAKYLDCLRKVYDFSVYSDGSGKKLRLYYADDKKIYLEFKEVSSR